MNKNNNNVSESKNAEKNIEKETNKEKIRIYIDPKLTDGGFTTNGRKLVGYIEVDETEAEDLKRRLEEYAEIKERLHNPSAKVTIKNSFVIEQLYLADPATNRNKPNWTDEYGLLDPWQWHKLPKEFQEELKARRYALYGIK